MGGKSIPACQRIGRLAGRERPAPHDGGRDAQDRGGSHRSAAISHATVPAPMPPPTVGRAEVNLLVREHDIASTTSRRPRASSGGSAVQARAIGAFATGTGVCVGAVPRSVVPGGSSMRKLPGASPTRRISHIRV